MNLTHLPPAVLKPAVLAEVGGTVIERVCETMAIAWRSLYSSFLTNVSNNLVCLGVLQRAFCPPLSLANTEDQIN